MTGAAPAMRTAANRGGPPVLGWFVLGVLVVVTSLSILYSRRVLDDISQLQSAEADNVQWTLTQVEIEFLSFANTLNPRHQSGQADLDNVRERYDILFSRLATFRDSPMFRGLATKDPQFDAALGELGRFMRDIMPLIDGPDDALRAALPRIAAATATARAQARALSVTGLAHFAVRADVQRREVARRLRQLGIAAASLLFLLLALSLHLLLVNRQKTRRGVALEQANQRMNTILSTSLDGVVVADSNGHILEFNGAAEEIFRCPSAQAKGHQVSELFVPDHLRSTHDADMARLRRGGERRIVGKGRVKLTAKRADGEIFPIELAVQSALDGETEILVAFVRDISKRVADEKELVQARDRALAGEKAKADFLTVMSHEIRTPLNGLLGNLSLLSGSRLDAEQRQFVRNMDVSGRILLKHVDSVLDIARFEAGKVQLSLERLNLSELLQNLVDGQSGNAGNRGNRLDWCWIGTPQHWIESDAQRIYQILLNLVGNAIKFTELGRVSIEAEMDPPGPDPARRVVEFRVSDTGPGIAEDQITTIFEDFHTSDTSFDRAAGGAGLGLGIARRIVTAMDGEIGVESVPDAGSTFWVRLPVRAAAAPARRETRPRPPSAPGGLDVLVVEDNEINLQVARSMLTREGHKVTCAPDGRQGVDMAALRRFDLIFMDISMPELDGLEATRLIRAGGGPSAETPIIALSANVLPQDKEKFRSAGMEAFLGKPLTLDALRRALCTVRSPRSVDDAPAREPPPGAPPDNTPPDTPMTDGKIAGDRPSDGRPPGARPTDDTSPNDPMAEARDSLGPEIHAALLQRFLEETDGFVAELGQAPGDAPDLAGRLHKLAGSAAVFGASDFRQMLNHAETAARTGDRAEIRAHLARIAPCWQATRARLTS